MSDRDLPIARMTKRRTTPLTHASVACFVLASPSSMSSACLISLCRRSSSTRSARSLAVSASPRRSLFWCSRLAMRALSGISRMACCCSLRAAQSRRSWRSRRALAWRVSRARPVLCARSRLICASYLAMMSCSRRV